MGGDSGSADRATVERGRGTRALYLAKRRGRRDARSRVARSANPRGAAHQQGRSSSWGIITQSQQDLWLNICRQGRSISMLFTDTSALTMPYIRLVVHLDTPGWTRVESAIWRNQHNWASHSISPSSCSDLLLRWRRR